MGLFGTKTKQPMKSAAIRPAQRGTMAAFFQKMSFGWTMREQLYEHMIVQIENDVLDTAALEKFQSQLLLRGKKDPARIIGDILRRMKGSGFSMAKAFQPWVPEEETRIIASGEAAGDISHAFRLIIEMNTRRNEIKRQISSAFYTPTIYVLIIYGFLLFVGLTLTPEFSKVLPNPSGAGAYLYAESRFVDSWQAFVPPVVVTFLVLLVIWSFPRWTGAMRAKADNYFPFSFYRDMQGYIWLINFSAMLSAGTPDTEILRQQLANCNPWLKERLRLILRWLSNEGTLLPNALQNARIKKIKINFPNIEMIDSIASVYGFGNSAKKLSNVAEQWAQRFDRKIKKKVKATAMFAELAVYGIMIFVIVGINSVSIQLGNSTTFH